MESNELIVGVLVLSGVSMSFFVSASAGLGGSLILVPMLTLLLGPKEGVSTAALLLAGNNIVKLVAYRRVLSFKPAALVTACTLLGAVVGAKGLVAMPERLVSAAVAVSLGAALIADKSQGRFWRGWAPWILATAAGATSGFTGTSGPLKGVAIRSLGLERMRTIGAAALVSSAADLMKTAVFAEAGLLEGPTLRLALSAIPLMLAATFAGRHFTQVLGEKGYRMLFRLVVGGYTARLLFVW